MPPIIQPDEPLSRFIVHKDWVRSSDQTLRWNAFLPHRGETSVFRTIDLSESGIWEIGERFVAEPQERNLIGRGDLKAFHATSRNLELVADGVPHERHANIKGWPDTKDKQKIIAIELAAESRVILKNPSAM